MFFRFRTKSKYNKENKEAVNEVLKLLQRSCEWERHGQRTLTFKHKTNGMILKVGFRYNKEKYIEINLWEDEFLTFYEKKLLKEVKKLKKKLEVRKNGIRNIKRVKQLKELKRVINDEYYYLRARIAQDTSKERRRIHDQIHSICRGKVHVKSIYASDNARIYDIWVDNHEDMVELSLTLEIL